MRECDDAGRPEKQALWGASDALLLEGLNGLNEQVGAAAAVTMDDEPLVCPNLGEDGGSSTRDVLSSESSLERFSSDSFRRGRALGGDGAINGPGPALGRQPGSRSGALSESRISNRQSEARLGLSRRFIEEAPLDDGSAERPATPETPVPTPEEGRSLFREVGGSLVTPSDSEAPSDMEESLEMGSEARRRLASAMEAKRPVSRKQLRREQRMANRVAGEARVKVKAPTPAPVPLRSPEQKRAVRPGLVGGKEESTTRAEDIRAELRQALPLAPMPLASPEDKLDEPDPVRLVQPQMETTVRRRKASSSSSFLPAVVISLFVTSLVWGALLLSYWRVVGDEGLTERIRQEAVSVNAGLSEELREGQTLLTQEVRLFEEEFVGFQESHERFVRMSALVAAMASDHSRQNFEDFLAIGQVLDTGSPALDYFKENKSRIEAAHIKRLNQHRGLSVASYFPQLMPTTESSLGAETLMEFVSRPKVSGWDRARGAILLRKFAGDEKVMAHLLQIVRDDQDLQVVFAAWESLIALSGYEPGSRGFSPDAFDGWWSTRHR